MLFTLPLTLFLIDIIFLILVADAYFLHFKGKRKFIYNARSDLMVSKIKCLVSASISFAASIAIATFVPILRKIT